MTFNQAISNARGIGVKTGAQIERELVAQRNADAGACECGARFAYSQAVGGYRASCGAFETSGGRVVRECGKRAD